MVSKFKEVVKFIRRLYNQPQDIIPLHAPVFNGNEKRYLGECIDTTFVSSVGRFVERFEQEIALFTGAKRAVGCVNGTNALHMALLLAGVNRDTEVITQPLTFVATANAITYCGAHPVFLDVDHDTMGLSPAALKNWLDKNVKPENHPLSGPGPDGLKPVNMHTGRPITACLPMHTFGHPCHIGQIVEICRKYNIPVVEDAAESLGSYCSPREISLENETRPDKTTISRGKGQHTGTFGMIGVLSFNGNKIVTTGGGGMLLFHDELLAERARHLTTQAKISHPWEMAYSETGYNYRMPNINAALGLAQFEQIETFLTSKRAIAGKYKQFFDAIDLQFVSEPQHASSNYWLNSILFHDRAERDAFLKFTGENGIMTRPAWRLMNRLEMFRDCQTDELRNAGELAERLVNLPSSPVIEVKR